MNKVFEHKEFHRKPNLSDLILGGQDGLVNVLGLVLGVAASSGDKNIILAAGFAAAMAESVSMGAVAYTSLMAKVDHYKSELLREYREVEEVPEAEKKETREIYQKLGLEGELLEKVVEAVSKNKEKWVNIMMSQELGLEPIDAKSVLSTSFVVGIATIVGSILPIAPFVFIDSANVNLGVWLSVLISGLSLFAVGVYKAKVSVGHWFKSGLQMFLIGMVAALIGYGIGLIFNVQGV